MEAGAGADGSGEGARGRGRVVRGGSAGPATAAPCGTGPRAGLSGGPPLPPPLPPPCPSPFPCPLVPLLACLGPQ